MTDPVDTNALRSVALGVGQVAEVEEDADQASWLRYVQRHVSAASDEVDRLRSVIKDAPHDSLCNQPEYPCRCWKSDAL